MDHLAFTSKKYFPRLLSTSSFEMNGPVYSIIRLPFGIGSRAKNPRPMAVRRMEYFMVIDILAFNRTYRTYFLYRLCNCEPPLVNSLSNNQAVDPSVAGHSLYGI